MMDTRVLDAATKQLAERLHARELSAADGGPKDWAEYKFLCGEINGLRLAQNTLEDLRKRLDKDDE